MQLSKFFMAKKHRKLFPAFTSINQTTKCPDFCDPACPDNCYTYPTFTYLPSPPPPPPPLRDESDHSFINSIYFIIIVSVVVGLFLLLSYYVIIVKPFAAFRRRRSGTNRSTLGHPGQEFQDDDLIHHPVWLITTVGLQQSMINSITICRYKDGEGLIEGTECSVCLNEFQENEMLRLLPKCSHAFHIPCIDTWLRSHTNCPLCRAPIVADRTVNCPSGSAEQSAENLNPNGVGVVENAEFGVNDENGINTEELNAVQDEDPGMSKDIQKSSECGDQPSKENEMHQFQRLGSLKSRLSDSVFIGLPYVNADNLEGSSVNVLLENVQENNSIAVFRRTESFPAIWSASVRAESIRRSFSCNGRL